MSFYYHDLFEKYVYEDEKQFLVLSNSKLDSIEMLRQNHNIEVT